MPIFNAHRRALIAAAATAPLAPLVQSQTLEHDVYNWRMITSWPKNSPGPGHSAERLARRLQHLSRGQLQIKVYGAGELVPALEVFDGVQQGVADLGHSAAFFWQGKLPASIFFTAVPFGLLPEEHLAWLNQGNGQTLWDELYAQAGLKPFTAGNSGVGMGGWFRRPIHRLEDLKGLKLRVPGLGGEVYRQLGAIPVSLPPSEIFAALQNGVVDGAEFVGPWSDQALGLHRTAQYYYAPGFHEPNGSSELLMQRHVWDTLPSHLQAVITNACMAEHATTLIESNWRNAVTIEQMRAQGRTDIRRFPDSVFAALHRTAEVLLADFGAQGSDLDRRIRDSYLQARRVLRSWSQLSRQPLLNAAHT